MTRIINVMKILAALTIYFVLSALIVNNVYGQKNYSVIHIIALTDKKIIQDNFYYQLIINQRQVADMKYSEALHYKIYSEGRMSFFPSLILDVVNGKDYYIKIKMGLTIKMEEVDSLAWYNLKAKCLYESYLEEELTNPLGKIDKSKRIGAGQGTCFALSSAGYFITNYHVIENAQKITIKGIKGDFTGSYEATVIASDKSNDLALLKVDLKNIQLNEFPYLIRSRGVQQGEKVYAIGFPIAAIMGQEVKVTDGIISSGSGTAGDISKFQISAIVNPGNSGGPLIDEQGNLIGVIYAKSAVADAASYAVKASYLEAFLKNIEEFEFTVFSNVVTVKPITEIISDWKKLIFIVETN